MSLLYYVDIGLVLFSANQNGNCNRIIILYSFSLRTEICILHTALTLNLKLYNAKQNNESMKRMSIC